ncbi:MAG: TonB-dependent receptor [Gammaproteobacteria bacterium]
MSSTSKFLGVLASLFFLACVVLPIPAHAADGISAKLEEVKVTARKRTESFEDVPVTVNVFTEAEIESAGIERPRDFIALTPNAQMIEVQNASNTFIGVRGITQNRNSEPSVAILMDGVLLSNPSQFNQELFDIEQIEFLKGPQGALYGRNAIGGAIVINTKKPSDTYEGKIKVGMDDGFGYRTQFVHSGPVLGIDNLYYRGAISYKDTDGWIDNTTLGKQADPEEDHTGRLRLLWEASDRVTADFRVGINRFEGGAFNYRIAATDAAIAANGPFSSFTGPFDANKVLDIAANNKGKNVRDMNNLSFKLDYEADYGTFTSITAYDEIKELAFGDNFDYLPPAQSVLFAAFGADQYQYQIFDIETFAQEFRFTSPGEDRLRWSAGAYMLWTERSLVTSTNLDFGTVTPISGSPIGVAPFTPFAAGTNASYLADSQDNFAWALFGDITYDVTDTVEAGLSLRFDRDTRENTTLTPTAFIPAGTTLATGQVRKRSWEEWQPKLSLRWSATDQHTVYSSIARGFRSGGFNQTGVGTDPVAQALGIRDTFNKEVADTIEIGVKSEWMNGRVKSNVAAFYTEAKGSYYFRFIPTSGTQNLGSLDEVSHRGFEIETSALVTDNLTMYAAVGVIDSEIENNPTVGGVNVEGNNVPYVSDWTLNLGASYRKPLNDIYSGLEGFLRADYIVTGETYWEPSNQFNRDPFDILDVRAGLDLNEEMTLTIWSRNVLDEEYNVEYSSGGFVTPARPRQIGVDFQYRF